MSKSVRFVGTKTLLTMLKSDPLDSHIQLDPDGKHILCWSFLHNDCEVRGLWMLKVEGTMVPLEVLLTVPIEAFNKAMEQAVTQVAA